jgi:hypothetical protein
MAFWVTELACDSIGSVLKPYACGRALEGGYKVNLPPVKALAEG